MSFFNEIIFTKVYASCCSKPSVKSWAELGKKNPYNTTYENL